MITGKIINLKTIIMDYSTIIAVIVILILIFLVLREVNCWYWKINERIELQKKTNKLLKLLINDQNPERFKLTDSFKLIDEETKFEL